MFFGYARLFVDKYVKVVFRNFLLKCHQVKDPKITNSYHFGLALSTSQIMIFLSGNFSINSKDYWY